MSTPAPKAVSVNVFIKPPMISPEDNCRKNWNNTNRAETTQTDQAKRMRFLRAVLNAPGCQEVICFDVWFT